MKPKAPLPESALGGNTPSGEARVFKVLVVDDQSLLADLLGQFISDFPDFAVVATAYSGAEALAAAVRWRPDLVLLDLRLPDMSGLEAIAALQRDTPASRIVMFSGALDDCVVRTALTLGASGVIEKGETLEGLLHVLRCVGNGSISMPARHADLFLSLADRSPGPAALDLEDLAWIRAIASEPNAASAARRMGVCLASLYRHQRRLVAATGTRHARELRSFAERIGLRVENSAPPLRPPERPAAPELPPRAEATGTSEPLAPEASGSLPGACASPLQPAPLAPP